ncbi:hypothetical protein [Streptomyces sp. NBC_00233]|uniref:hypothetical protein n=1 Tax=Streptomyces sp. NBC_00233 TaxID=2975686 RepID=UPI00224E3695|nr:hypothetical protein [Streptomyces sp. NBC_00233]MCX5233519.1 hypothetical protein [Streptomyces sp. NBC_00233]
MQVDTSCCSWLPALRVAQVFIESGLHKRGVLLMVTNSISRLREFQKSGRSAVLGDSASAPLMGPVRRALCRPTRPPTARTPGCSALSPTWTAEFSETSGNAAADRYPCASQNTT